ncbi:aryl-alcohol dehydrogenase-like predicted oxidoreductase [Actinocorallia herbida]|uniref:Aryl-alcohol dehydrogenase-like predicted oxidoreductase n=1 Tax=Actinocorallia herbida TaxID=58109 RepID=A0A3N1DA48_9ACTN|nr:aldo/keto reductase [Actinocorallia herbida]ROO90403.1 aryl-alcohol dehydrogenase-like predicted oxidoreductase [Actinocorallia herbida]
MTTATFALGGNLTVRRLGFGAMRLARSSFGAPIRPYEQGLAVLRRAVDLGVDHIDTAGFYGTGETMANRQIRDALHPYPQGLVIATKVGPLRDDRGLPLGQAGPDGLRALVETDLADLGLDRLDLVYLRVGGMNGPGGESIAARFEALAALREEGLIRHLGVSNVDAAQLAEARAIAPVASVQNPAGHDDLLTECEKSDIAFVPFFSIDSGALSSAAVATVAARHGATPAQVAIAAALASSPATLAIPGTGSLDHLAENQAAANLELDPEDLELLR